MKNKAFYAVLLLLSACAKERTTQHFTTQGQMKPAVTTPQGEEPQVKTQEAEDPFYITKMKEDFEQKDLSDIYQAFNVKETELPKPEDVICEFIPQLRKQKKLGRLTCLKQTPQIGNQDPSEQSSRYECEMDFTPGKGFESSDQAIYEALTIPEVEDEHGYIGSITMTKQIGRFHCNKITRLDTRETRYECAVYGIFAANETKSAP